MTYFGIENSNFILLNFIRLDNDFREKREEIGKLCKQLLNMGRVVYMQNHGYDARLIEFIDFDITPENICLIVVPDRYIDE